MFERKHLAVPVLAGLAAFGCTSTTGDSVGAGGATLASLNGSYNTAIFIDADTSRQSCKGTTAFDGAGGFNSSVTCSNSASGANIATGVSGGTYTVNSDGTFTILNGATILQAGALRSDGSAYLAARTDDQTLQRVAVGIKQPVSNSFNNASLSGSYNTAVYIGRDTSRQSCIGTATFDGSGGFDSSLTCSNSQTGANVSATVVGGTYSVNSDGTFTVFNGATIVQTGALNSDGSIYLASRTDDQTVQRIAVGLKTPATSTFSNASLSGSYDTTVYIGRDTARQSCIGTATFDGAGGFNSNLTCSNSQTGANVSATVTGGTYTVNSNGTFTIFNGATILQTGALSGDGSTYVASRTDDQTLQRIAVGMKR